ncbi:uncharacterized protein EV154DRAFT_550004 [Mucor mucedo]|uniref:uncharacterized protein n=1 Tax=Mucor mucedo TaxID=29922 RepID=UPI00221F5AED|nr:uncharacterized protein EV154DRAFT_550004 [Mucor mucedo]KAI7893443.1 hypothetical protein EV154DRAFT_550004 [Mucor mucedo]
MKRALHQDIYKHIKPSTLLGVLSYFSQSWAENRYIISNESIKDNMTIPFDPMVVPDLKLMEYDMLKNLVSSLKQSVSEEAINDAKLKENMKIRLHHQRQRHPQLTKLIRTMTRIKQPENLSLDSGKRRWNKRKEWIGSCA